MNYLDNFPIDIGFNLLLLENGIRKLYFMDILTKLRYESLNNLPSHFRILYYKVIEKDNGLLMRKRLKKNLNLISIVIARNID